MIAAAVVYLCSDAAAFVVGHAMVIDGGQTVWWPLRPFERRRATSAGTWLSRSDPPCRWLYPERAHIRAGLVSLRCLERGPDL